MTKHKRDLIIAVLLVTIFIFSLIKNATRRAPGVRGILVAAGQALPTVNDSQTAFSSLELVRQNERNLIVQEAFWEKEWGRDPFFYPSNTTSSGTNLVLSGIVWDATMPIAMINEKVLKVGDVIEGYRIGAITPGFVMVVAPSGKESKVQLFESISGQ